MNALATRRRNIGSPMAKEARDSGQPLVNTSLRPYYSKVRLPAVRTGASGSYVYTVAQGTSARAFGYAVSQDMAPGGRSGTIATVCDTNIENPRRTNNGEEVEIDAIGIQTMISSDVELLQAAEDCVSVRMELGVGGMSIPLGTITMWPAGLGLYGNGNPRSAFQSLPGGRPVFGNFTNGVPAFQNIRPVPEKLLWRQSSKSDSSLAFLFTAERAIVVTTTGTDEAAAAGVRGYTMPTELHIDLMVHILGDVRSKESINFR
jgi:hypothetical protein